MTDSSDWFGGFTAVDHHIADVTIHARIGGRVSAGAIRWKDGSWLLVNLRPALLSAAVSRATVLMPEVVMMRHLATIAARSAFQLPTRNDAGQ